MAVPDHPESNRRFRREGPDVDRLERAPLDTMPNGSFTSSNVHSALYDFGAQELFVRYLRDGEPDAIYQYDNVPASVWSALVEADSKGGFINDSVAYQFSYSKAGTGDFPDRGAIDSGLLRQFVHAP